MYKPSINHVRHHAHEHHKAHLRLKDLLSRPIYKERVWHIFVSTFVIVLATIIIFLNWGRVADFFTPAAPTEDSQTQQAEESGALLVHGFQSGVLSNYEVDYQITDSYRKYLSAIPSSGHLLGMQAVHLVGLKEEEKVEIQENALENSIWLTNMLSTGQHLTKMEQGRAMALQKSMLATFYLGEKTIDIDSTIQTDSQLLSQINNALAVDLFQYLNQSNNRADTLDNYINLLNIILEKTNERINDLESKINFLTANYGAQEQQIAYSEEVFFENLDMFNGPNAEDELSNFIGLQEAQVEVKAKIGAYQKLQDYYVFFQPKLENLITAIRANRDALIAGVKVVEIQNMTLPLIIRQ
ncbi:hypothetical protein KJ742_04770 [Patescibacteria group bacterium]|nr:hypothetical protein [Patescibacteria group bacterium]MBU1683232.1 hypothetical protein [Patescibacteria group bacterium]MBU1935741.1 hypothetical protein [Patescibacteria group bacterium]